MDAHVHIHGRYRLSGFFDSATSNFRNAARSAGQGWPCDAALLLAETSEANAYGTLRRIVGSARRGIGQWTVESTRESAAIIVRNRHGEQLFVIAGRQITTAENLEVLALATDHRFADGLPVRTTLAAVIQSDAIPVIPWGFGKWTGQRGRLVAKLIEEVGKLPFYLGDTSHRLGLAPAPGEFTIGAEKGIKILPGTDPLPFASQASRPGRYGFRVQGSLSADKPATDLKRLVSIRDLSPYGETERLIQFGLNQLAMQLRKRALGRRLDPSSQD